MFQIDSKSQHHHVFIYLQNNRDDKPHLCKRPEAFFVASRCSMQKVASSYTCSMLVGPQPLVVGSCTTCSVGPGGEPVLMPGRTVRGRGLVLLPLDFTGRMKSGQ